MEYWLIPKKSAQIFHDVATLVADLRTLNILTKKNKLYCHYDGEHNPIVVEIRTDCSDTYLREREKWDSWYSCVKRTFFDRFEDDGIVETKSEISCFAFKIGPSETYFFGRRVPL